MATVATESRAHIATRHAATSRDKENGHVHSAQTRSNQQHEHHLGGTAIRSQATVQDPSSDTGAACQAGLCCAHQHQLLHLLTAQAGQAPGSSTRCNNRARLQLTDSSRCSCNWLNRALLWGRSAYKQLRIKATRASPQAVWLHNEIVRSSQREVAACTYALRASMHHPAIPAISACCISS